MTSPEQARAKIHELIFSGIDRAHLGGLKVGAGWQGDNQYTLRASVVSRGDGSVGHDI